jgi:hypothetical protein
VESGAVPNVVAIAADREGIIYEGGSGPRVPDESGTVDAGTRFRIMSMTKMVATVAALQLPRLVGGLGRSQHANHRRDLLSVPPLHPARGPAALR